MIRCVTTCFKRLCGDKRAWQEIIIAGLIMLMTAVASYHLYGMHDTQLITTGEDVWFQSDSPRLVQNMTNRFAYGHQRVKVHPLHSLLAYPPTQLFVKCGFEPLEAVKLFTVTVAALWALCIYLLMRIIGCLRTDALLLTLLACSSAAAMFWFSVLETYGLGSISMMLPLMLAAYAHQKKIADWVYVLVSAFSLSVTLTNWMAGIASTFAAKTIKRTVLICMAAFFIVVALWALQKKIFPAAGFLFVMAMNPLLCITHTSTELFLLSVRFSFIPSSCLLFKLQAPHIPRMKVASAGLWLRHKRQCWGLLAQ